MEHVVAEGFIGDIEFERIRSYDYGGIVVSSLDYNLLGSHVREPFEHRLRLLNDIRHVGVQQPVVVVKNDIDGFVLVEGHHRVVLANDLKIKCPMYVIYCDCGVSLFESYCSFVEKFNDTEFDKTISSGWFW